MADHYDKLTEAEQADWDCYTRLRELSDHDGFSDGQNDRRQKARDWLVNQRKFIWRCAEGKETPEYKAGWDINNRSERYAQLKDDKLNSGSCRRVAQLPSSGNTAQEKVFIQEREMWWMVASVDEDTKKWRGDNSSWLVERRKKVWHLGEDHGWDEAERDLRYNNLCIVTCYGSPYEEWKGTHNPDTGAEKETATSSRQACINKCKSYIGVTESPPNSNKGRPQPSEWQKRVYGDDGVPWCACFTTCMAWDSGVKGSATASVQLNVNMARQGQGMYRAYTHDLSRVLRGDHVAIGSESSHIEVVAETPSPGATSIKTIGGNTSPGSNGSQYNGGGCFSRTRSVKGECVGFLLVDFP